MNTAQKECAQLLEQLRDTYSAIQTELQKERYNTFNNTHKRQTLYLTGALNSRYKQSPKDRLLAAISSGLYVNSEDPLVDILKSAELSIDNTITRTLYTLVTKYVAILKQLKTCESINEPNSSYLRRLQKYVIGPERNVRKLNNSNETIEFLKEELGPSDLDRFLLFGKRSVIDRHKYITQLIEILIRRYKAGYKGEFEANKDYVRNLLSELDDSDLDRLEISSDGTPYRDLFFETGSTNELNVFKNTLKRRIANGNNEGAFTSLINIIELYIQKGKFEDAETFLKKELRSNPSDIYRQELNNYLVVVLLYQDKRVEAIELLTNLLDKELIEEPPNNDYILSLISLLIDISKEGKGLPEEEIEVLYKKKLEIQKEELGINHPDTITALNEYLKYVGDNNNYEDAKSLIEAELPKNQGQYYTIVNYYLSTLEPNSVLSSKALASRVFEGGTRKFSRSNRMATRCRKGKILRSAYTRKSGKTVKAACIKNVGRPGKGLRTGGPGIGTLKKGLLAKFGYSDITNKSDQARHAALDKAVKAYGALSVFRKLNAVYVYTKITSPASSKIFLMDRDWIRSQHM